MPAWDKARQEAGDGRHHLRRPADVEAEFWAAFDGGASLPMAVGVAGVGRSTGYRWVHRRFLQLRQDDVPVGASARCCGWMPIGPTGGRGNDGTSWAGLSEPPGSPGMTRS